MSDTGWQWVGPKPVPPPDPGPEPKPKGHRRFFFILGGVAALVIVIALLIQALQVARLRQELAAADATGAAPLPALAAEPSTPEETDELTRLRHELPRLRGEVQRLRAENEALAKKIAEFEAQSGNHSDANAMANLQVRAFQLNTAAVTALTARPEGSTEYREFAAFETLRRTFSTVGVDFTPPKSLYYNATSGKLLVRASERDMTLIEQALVSGGLQ
jgi:hypothetical protein